MRLCGRNLLNEESKSDRLADGFRGSTSGRICKLKIIAAGFAVDIKSFADDIEVLQVFTFHGFAVHFRKGNPACCYHGFFSAREGFNGKSIFRKPLSNGFRLFAGREPALSELAQATGLTPEEIAAAETANEPVVSLQAEAGTDGLTLEGVLTAGNEEERVLEKLTLRAAIAALPQREQQVLLLRYYRGMTQMDAARVLGVSQVQVSRLERRAVGKLQEMMV